MDHAWFAQLNSQPSLCEDKKLEMTSAIASFRKTTTFQSGVCSLIANLYSSAEDLADLRKMFCHLDKNNDGFVTFDELESGMNEVCEIFHLDAPDIRQIFKQAD